MTKVMVTGGAGFIGSNYIRHALRSHPDWEIWNLDKLTYAGNLANLEDVAQDPRYHFVRGDIANAKTVDSVTNNGFDTIINFAAETHVDRSIHSGNEFLHTNVLGTNVLLEAARHHKVKTFVHISTDEVYGDLPAGEFAKESDSLKPSSPYAASKAAADLLVLAHVRTYGLPAMITRGTNNYGPYQHPEKMLPLFVTNLLPGKKVPVYGDGQQVRDWLHVDDHCRAIDIVLEKGNVGEIYNIGANHQPEWRNLEVTKLILDELGMDESMIEHVTDRPGHDRRYAVEVRKIKDLGWKIQVPAEEGLRGTVRWYRDHQDWWATTPRAAASLRLKPPLSLGGGDRRPRPQ
ncbi:MAG: dTDP-glucose 4,6-dehydratase [Candidatus Kerfeldbacteria bacterium]|nr:dTDP-glucose 4,6-dehydratase [Candidatus Kerfeldbacteria bacterium]